MPHQIKAWTKQRTRWLKGFMLTALVYTRNPARTWRTFGRAGTLTMLTFMAGTPLLYLAQPIVLAIWASHYTGFAARHLPASSIVWNVQLAVFIAWTALVAAAARRHKLASAVFAPLLPAYWAMHWTASWRGLYQLIRAPFLWEKTPHPSGRRRVRTSESQTTIGHPPNRPAHRPQAQPAPRRPAREPEPLDKIADRKGPRQNPFLGDPAPRGAATPAVGPP